LALSVSETTRGEKARRSAAQNFDSRVEITEREVCRPSEMPLGLQDLTDAGGTSCTWPESACRTCECSEPLKWVDSMCITQNIPDKHNQMKSIEAVYRGATLTLVAAAGDDADVRLPCFNGKLFTFRQRLARIQGLSLANISTDFETSVDRPSRAWTYQERLLSRRLLIFTKDRTYFQCDYGIAQGDVGMGLHDPDYI